MIDMFLSTSCKEPLHHNWQDGLKGMTADDNRNVDGNYHFVLVICSYRLMTIARYRLAVLIMSNKFRTKRTSNIRAERI